MESINNSLEFIESTEPVSEINRITSMFFEWGKNILPMIISALIIFILGWWLSSVIDKIFLKAMKRSKLDVSMITFLNSLIKVCLKTIVVIAAIAELGVNVNSIIAAIGAVGVTAGLAVKDTLSNLSSGILLVLNKHFEVGDYVEINNVEGTVSKVEIMFTTLLTPDNKTISIPNSIVTANNIINYTTQGTRRLDIIFSIGYNDDILKAKNILQEIINSNPLIINKQSSLVAVNSQEASSVDIIVKVWCKADDYLNLKYQLSEIVKNSFDENNIAIPYNQLDIHMS